MEVLDPGHVYALRRLDVPESGELWQPPERLTFVKREGLGYPGNVGSHPGTTTQEVLRALIDRTQYVNGQIPSEHNEVVLRNLRAAIWHLELRAAERHGRLDDFTKRFAGSVSIIETLPTCLKCNHIGCEGECHA